MRISERHRYNLSANRVETARSDNAALLEELSTQKKLNKLSDNPVDVAQVLRERSRVERKNQFEKNIQYAQGYLERTESVVTGIYDFLLRAKELSVAMANDTYGPQARRSAGREVKEIIEAITSLANKTFGNRYIFGGFRTQTPPMSGDGKFLGDDGTLFLQVDDNQFKQINLNARSIFEVNEEERQEGHFDLVAALDILYQGLVTDDVPMIQRAMDELDNHMDRISNYQSKIGAIFNSLKNSFQNNEVTRELTTKSISELEDADVFKSSSDFKRTESVLQSTLLASSKLLQPSLLNFLQ